MHKTAIDSAAREGRLLRAKHADSSLPGRFDPVVFRGWIAEGQAHSRADRGAPPSPMRSRHCATAADPMRGVRWAQRCARSARRTREPGQPDGAAPDWLAIRP